MPEPKSHSENRGGIEQLLRRIPGFRGYLEKEYRRESDALQRQFLATELQRSKRGLDALARSLADAGQIEQLPQCDRLRGRLDQLIARIAGAMQGYSGLFDLVRVDESLLDRVYDYDLTLVDEVQILADGVRKLETSTGGPNTASPSDALNGLLEQINKIQQDWDHRNDLLRGLE